MDPSTFPARTTVAAWSLLAVYAVLALLSATLGALAGQLGNASALLWAGYAVVGALVAARQPRNAVGWLLLAVGLTSGLDGVADGLLRSDLLGGSAFLAWYRQWGWYAWLSILLLFLPLAFPDGRLLTGHRRPITVLGLLAVGATMAGAAFGSVPVPFGAVGGNPLAIPGTAGALFSRLETAGQLLLALTAALGAVSLVVRLRGSQGVERQQMKWFTFAALLPPVGWGLARFSATVHLESTLGALGWGLFLLGAVVAIPAATGLSIFRHRLYDIDLVIRRTLVYGTLTATLLATYVGCVLLLNLLLNPLAGGSDLAVACSTLAAAALFRPARRRIQATVDRRFYRRRYDATRTLEDFTTRLRHQLDLDTVGTDLCTAAHDTVQPAHVSLWIRP
jgi:hypothetical protein